MCKGTSSGNRHTTYVHLCKDILLHPLIFFRIHFGTLLVCVVCEVCVRAHMCVCNIHVYMQYQGLSLNAELADGQQTAVMLSLSPLELAGGHRHVWSYLASYMVLGP